MPHFGKKVVGAKEYDAAVRSEKGGGNVFGKRVRAAIPDDHPTNRAKRVTEHGPRVVSNVSGTGSDALSVDDLKRLLIGPTAENVTMFDNLYENELARPDGARPEALEVLLQAEISPRGAQRKHIIDDIRALLGAKTSTADTNANRALVQRERITRQRARMEQNAKLVDADKVKALKERQEALDALDEAGEDYDVSASADIQLQDIAKEQGIKLTETGGYKPSEPASPTDEEHGNRKGSKKGKK